MEKNNTKVFKIDFDGTCVLHDFPRVGKNIGAGPVLRALTKHGHKIILWTVRSHKHAPHWSSEDVKKRSGEYLNDAIAWFEQQAIPLYKTNEPSSHQKTWSDSPKPHADYIIDDLMIGDCVNYDIFGKRMVRWDKVWNYLYQEHLRHGLFPSDMPLSFFNDISIEIQQEINSIDSPF